MSLIKFYKRNIKLVYAIFLLIIMSIANTIEGFIYSYEGFTYKLVIIEIISLISTLFLLNLVWCVFDDGKCITVKKDS